MTDTQAAGTSPAPRKVLLLESYRQTLTALRSLRRAGFHTIMGREAGTFPLTMYSEATRQIWEHPPLSHAEQFIPALEEFLAAEPGCQLIVPVGDISQDLLIGCREKLPATVCMPPSEVVLLCRDKHELASTAVLCGIPVPKSVKVHAAGELMQAVEEIGLPCVVKPRTSLMGSLGKKALYLDTRQSVQALSDSWPSAIDELLVQKRIQGLRHNVDFIAERGVLKLMFESRALRVDTFDPSGYTVDAVSRPAHPKLERHVSALLSALDYTGVGLLQFIYEEDEDDYYLLELNPRLGAGAAFPFALGIDIPLAAVTLAEGMPVTVNSGEYKKGIRCNWAMGDLLGLLHAINHGEVDMRQALAWFSRMIDSAVHAHHHLTWSLDDPWPSLSVAREIAAAALRRAAPVGGAVPQ